MAKQKDFNSIMQDLFDDAEYEKTFIGKDNPYEVVTPIPTGSFSLDVSIGIGGIPKRRFTVLDGLESSGKTTLAFSIAKNAIEKLGDKVLYVETENQMDRDYAQVLLGNPSYLDSSFILTKPNTSDDAFNIIEAGIRCKEFGLIVVDSVAALAPKEEKDKKFEDANMAIIPRDIAHFFRRNVFEVRTNNIAVLFVNQLRDNIGSYVKSYTSPGGHALKYFASVMLNLKKESDIKAGEEVIGIMSKFVVKKNKLSAPFRSYPIPIVFGKGIDSGRDMLNFSESIGVVKRAGPYYKFEDQNIGRGFNDAMRYLTSEEGKPVMERITNACYDLIKKTKVEVSEEDVLE
jgi:recombination protein RecA